MLPNLGFSVIIMEVQIVSYILGLNSTEKLSITADIIDNSNSDLIFFPGDTLDTIDDALNLMNIIRNKKSTILFEVSQLPIGDLNDEIIHCPFLIQKGKLINLHTFQFFTTSDIIENNVFLAEAFVNELETRRQFEVGDYKCMVLLCGENNILKNLQSDNNRIIFRVDDNQLEKRFKKVINGVDMILNPIHKPQSGNQNKLHKRREYFSKNKRVYLSTNNCETLSSYAKSIQYIYYNGEELEKTEPLFDDEKKYMYRLFEL